MWNIETTIYIYIITSCKIFCSKTKFYDFFGGKKTPYNPYSKSKCIDSFELVWTYRVHFWVFPWYLKRHNGCLLGSTWPNNIVQNPHAYCANYEKSFCYGTCQVLAIAPVSQPVQTHCCCQGSPKFLTSASLTGHNSLFLAHSTIHIITYCLGSLRQSILFP